LLDLSL